MANFAKLIAVGLASSEYPISNKSSSESEVKIVTAVIEISFAASLAALIMAAPPLAWIVRNLGARSATEDTAAETVFGMSCNFKSRKIEKLPAFDSSRKPCAPNRK